MTANVNIALMLGAALSAVAALLHVGIIFGGAPWYRFFGAGEDMARASDAGRIYPAIVTAMIATTLGAWSAYALSGAGFIGPLPLLKFALIAITAVYLLRGFAIIPLVLWARPRVTPFLVWSSLICIGYGAVHLIGLRQVWPALS